MTINSEQVLPGNDQQPPNPADPNGAPAPQASTEPEIVDIDAQDLADAQAAVEAEKAAAGGEAGSQAQPGAPAASTTIPPQGQPPAPSQDSQVMIPKARLDEVSGQRDQERQNAAYWRGVAEARAHQPGQPQGGAQPQPPQQQATPEQRLAAIHTKQDELAAKFDNGEITYSDLVKQQRELNLQEQGIREQQLLAKTQPAAPAPAPQSDALYLDNLTAQLETEHPWVQVFDKVGTEIDWKYLKDRAIENCVARGVDVTKGDIGKYQLRKEVAILADTLGPNLIGDRARAKGIAIPDAQQPAAQQQQPPPGLSPTAQARANKLDLAEGAPPNVARMSGATGDGTPTDSRIEQMSDDDIGNLPDSTRRKLLGIM